MAAPASRSELRALGHDVIEHLTAHDREGFDSVIGRLQELVPAAAIQAFLNTGALAAKLARELAETRGTTVVEVLERLREWDHELVIAAADDVLDEATGLVLWPAQPKEVSADAGDT